MSDDPGDEAEGGTDTPPDGTVDAADPSSVKRAVRKKQRAADEAAEFWQRVFADPVGRREMWGWLEAGHAFEERFACGPTGVPQTEATWLYAGEQKLAMRLYLTWLKLARPGVLAMHDEHDPNFRKPPKRARNQDSGP